MRSILLRSLSVRFNDVRAVDNVSFSVRKGEITGLVGPNGSGKSTILRILTGLVKPDSGSIIIDDHTIDTKDNEFKRIIGYSPQDNSFFKKLTVRENLEYFASLYNIGENLDKLTGNLTRALGINDKIEELAENLSGGMKRRLNIACSLMHRPEILLLDEPSIELDPVSRNSLWELIRSINDNGTTIIVSTNIMEEAQALCDKLVFLSEGKVYMQGNTNEVLGSVFGRGSY